MSMSKSNVRMRRGFMCQSPASTAVGCMPDDMRSVIVPCKSNGRSMVVNHHLQHGRIGSNVKYSRLVDSSDERLTKGKKRREILLQLGDRNNVKSDPQALVSQEQQRPRSLQISSSVSTQIFQVVVLRVSLHCQGCAGKVKKHLSRMEGVTSFSIDLETKRVTVMGHVSPAGVLESISKIKRAEFWTC